MIRAVVKVGGSLSRGEHLPALGQRLGDLGKRHPLLVVPGGGPFADAVRVQDQRFGLGNAAAHWMAILGMEQYGWLLADLIPGGEPVRTLAAARAVAQAGRVPILLPWTLLYAADPLPHSWDVTSDSIAAWIAGRVRVPLLVLLKDVDGLLESPSAASRPRLREGIAVEELGRFGIVDGCLPGLVCRYELDLWLVNGQRPERLVELLSTGTTTGTRVAGQGGRMGSMRPDQGVSRSDLR
jgi:5-(aminomethyl)-3-furanmethanol phosphate kinase